MSSSISSFVIIHFHPDSYLSSVILFHRKFDSIAADSTWPIELEIIKLIREKICFFSILCYVSHYPLQKVFHHSLKLAQNFWNFFQKFRFTKLYENHFRHTDDTHFTSLRNFVDSNWNFSKTNLTNYTAEGERAPALWSIAMFKNEWVGSRDGIIEGAGYSAVVV